MLLKGLRILLVEDNGDAREIWTMLLQRYGASVEAAANAVDAVAAFERQPPDCIVSDINMPNHDGLWLIRQVRAREIDTRTPAIAVTARVGHDDRRVILAAGFDVHLPKPVDVEVLLAAIQHIVAGRRLPGR
jgi:CheY-like chemotaxis protein